MTADGDRHDAASPAGEDPRPATTDRPQPLTRRPADDGRNVGMTTVRITAGFVPYLAASVVHVVALGVVPEAAFTAWSKLALMPLLAVAVLVGVTRGRPAHGAPRGRPAHGAPRGRPAHGATGPAHAASGHPPQDAPGHRHGATGPAQDAGTPQDAAPGHPPQDAPGHPQNAPHPPAISAPAPGRRRPARRRPPAVPLTLLLAAIALSWLGDGAAVFLPFWPELPVMLASFGLAHLAYIVLFWRHLAVHGVPRWAFVYAAWWVATLAVLWPRLGALGFAVAGYGLVLGGTAVLASRCRPAVAFGGALFLASDTVLAFRLFAPELMSDWTSPVVMLTYTLGQGLIALGAITALRGRHR